VKAKRFVLCGVLLCIGAAVLVLVTVPGSKGRPPAPEVPTGRIDTGRLVESARQTVPASGGTVIVDKPGGPLHGLTIDVPDGAFDAPQEFKVSEAPITSHTFGEDLSPISPLINIENGSEHSDEPMVVTIPVKVPQDEFAMAFFYDSDSGALEAMPLVASDTDKVTVLTRHFSSFVVSAIKKAVLRHGSFDSGFRPGTDDWHFSNTLTFASPKGVCNGMSASAMWYYVEKACKGAPRLHGLYDEGFPGFWMDDRLALRLVSAVQCEERRLSAALLYLGSYVMSDTTTYNAFAYAMMLTRRPQAIALNGPDSGHMMVAYKAEAGKLYIADPSFPGKENTIALIRGEFSRYGGYTKVRYAGNAAFIKWKRMEERWAELESGSVGSDLFPDYGLRGVTEDGTEFPLRDGCRTDAETFRVALDKEDRFSARVAAFYSKDRATREWVQLKPGKNRLSIILDDEDESGGY